MKNILLPTDFSENSVNAIFYALDMYREDSCRFILLNAYKVNGYDSQSRLSAIPGDATLEKAQQEADNQLKDLILEVSKKKEDTHDLVGISSNSHLVDAVKKQIRKNDIEVVIIGTQGSTGAYEVVYGSNTKNIMEEVENCPVLAVPSHVSFKKINEIVLPNGYKLRHNKEDFGYINYLAKKFDAAVRILHVMEDDGLSSAQKANKKHLALYLRDTNHSFHALEHVSLPIGIYCFTESRDSDLIAFVNKKHNFFQNLLLSPLYKNLGHYSNVPVLVLHQTKNKE